jgi:hypothetical protein
MSSSYELRIQIGSQAVQMINESEQAVVIVKEVEDGPSHPTIWVAFRPSQNTSVTWTDKYGIFAAEHTKLDSGTRLVQSATVSPALPGFFYPYENGVFGAPAGAPPKENMYGFGNHSGNLVAFGLAQSVSVDGELFSASPVNAALTMTSQKAAFTPTERVRVFLSSFTQNGFVLQDPAAVQSRMVISDDEGTLTVDLTFDSLQTIHYDQARGAFVPGELQPSR